VLGDDHPDTMLCACELAAILRELGDNRAARELAEETCDRSRRNLGADHPDTLLCARELAAILRQLGDTRAARELGKIYALP
jgi:16S rRNA C1402 N4-methylase RsmH